MMPDSYDLDRFVQAQARNYLQALSELEAGCKRSHWMWYVFPQLAGLGYSATSRFFALADLGETRSYLDHPLLGSRLRACSQVLLSLESLSARDIFGVPDDAKLRSTMTLFAQVAPAGSVFHQVLDRYFLGEMDAKTLALLQSDRGSG